MNKKLVESKLAEAFEATIKDMQKEGLLENVNSFDLDFDGSNIKIGLTESVEKIEEMGIRTPHSDKDINPYATCPHVKFMHPENRWCEFLAAAYFWPKYHNGELLQPQEYQGKNGWDYANQDSAYFGTLVNKAGYLERVKTPGSIGLGAYKVTPLGEKVMRYMIRSFGERACNPFETVKGDRMERHNLEPTLTKKDDQMYQGEVAFSYQGVHDAEPRERTVLPVAVYDRDIDTGTQRRIFGYDTGNMEEDKVRKLKRIFARTNQELKRVFGQGSDLKGIKFSSLILDTLDDEQKELYKNIQNKAIGNIKALGVDSYYRNFLLDRAEKVVPTNRGNLKTGRLGADDNTFHNINRRSNFVEDDFED